MQYHPGAVIPEPYSPPLRSDLLDGLNAAQRKEYPLYSGVIAYFRDALLRVAHVSYVGNQQHNPGEPLHWARGKSTDQLDCVARHLASCDGEEAHKAAMAWRALADLQLYLEQKYNIMPPPNAKDPDNTTFHHPV